jgi:hypothetical protein
MPVRIEGEALKGKGHFDKWAAAVSRTEAGEAPGKEGEGSQQVMFQSVPGRRSSGGHS